MNQSNSIPLYFCSIAFRTQPLTDLIAPLAQIGYDGIEIIGPQVNDLSDADLTAIRNAAEVNRIALPVVSPYFVLTRGQEEYDTTIKTAQRFVHIARQLGATKVRTFTDVADGVGSDIATEQHWEQAVRGLREITAMAPELQFVVETHPKTLADTVPTILQLLERVGSDNLKVNVQPTETFIAYGMNATFDALQPHVTHMHFHQVGRDVGDGWVEEAGKVDFPNFVNHIKQAGYRGSISVEYCFKGVTWERAQSAHDYMRQLLA